MKKRIKLALTISGAVVFLLLASTMVLYSRGYRFDFSQKKLVKTGAIFVYSEPRQAQVSINGKKEKRTSLVFGSTLIENLLPRSYRVTVQKADYKNWEKNLEVREGAVTSAKNVILVPELETQLLDKNIKDIWVGPGAELIFFQKQNSENESWSLNILNLEKESITTLVNNRTAPLDLEKTIWLMDQKKILLKTEEEIYFLPLDAFSDELENILPALPEDTSLLPQAEPVFFAPQNPDLLYFKTSLEQKETSLLSINLADQKEKVIIENFESLSFHGRDIYWIDQQGNLNKSDLNGNNQLLPFLLPSLEQDPQLMIFDSEIFILSDRTLYQLDREEMAFKEIEAGVRAWSLSPDRTKMALWNKNEIKVLFIKEHRVQPLYSRGEIAFLARFSGEIKQVFWWNNSYLVLSEQTSTDQDSKPETKIKVIEIDNRDKAQAWEIISVSSPEIYFDLGREKLFFLSQERLFISKPF